MEKKDLTPYYASSMNQLVTRMRPDGNGGMRSSIFSNLNPPPQLQHTTNPNLSLLQRPHNAQRINSTVTASRGGQNQVRILQAEYSPQKANNMHSLTAPYNPLAPSYARIPMEKSSQLNRPRQQTHGYEGLQKVAIKNATALQMQQNLHLGTVTASSSSTNTPPKGKMVSFEAQCKAEVLQPPPNGKLSDSRKGVIKSSKGMMVPLYLPNKVNWAFGPLMNTHNLDVIIPYTPLRTSTPSLSNSTYQGICHDGDSFLYVYKREGTGEANAGAGSDHRNFTTTTNNSQSSSKNNYDNQGNNRNIIRIPIPNDYQVNNSVALPADPILPVTEGMARDNMMQNQSNREASHDDGFDIPEHLLNMEELLQNNKSN